MAQDETRFSWHDYDGEPASIKINTVEITAANLDAQATLATALRTAMNGILIATVEQAVITDNIWDTVAETTDPFGQREIKWTVIVQDTAGNKYKANELPCADLSLLEGGNKYIVKNGFVTVTTGATAVQAFVDAYEAFALSNAGLALTIVDMYQSGRNT
jgi:hypothetical protein